MKRRRLLVFFLIALFFLQACDFYDSTYVVESDFPLPVREVPHGEQVAVHSLAELREAIRAAVSAGASYRIIVFDSGYSGSQTEDLSSAIWHVRTEDALCAYCVENISYDLNQIVSHVEARLTITYSPLAVPVSEIVTIPYATALDDRLAEAIAAGRERLAILISRSTLTAETFEARVEEVYHHNPALSPCAPLCSVTLLSGTGTQKLYELTMETGLSHEEFLTKKAALDSVHLTVVGETETARALAAAEFLIPRCHPDGDGSVYASLVEGSANPEGIALGYVALCRELGLECLAIEGQKDWQDHFWNIVRIDGHYFHVDLFSGLEKGFLKCDEDFWGSYRWNINDYPKCETRLVSDDQRAPEATDEQTEDSDPHAADRPSAETENPAAVSSEVQVRVNPDSGWTPAVQTDVDAILPDP